MVNHVECEQCGKTIDHTNGEDKLINLNILLGMPWKPKSTDKYVCSQSCLKAYLSEND